MLCPICSTELVSGNRFCQECGTTIDRVEQQVRATEANLEIKAGTVLCASIEGYIRLCEILPLTEVGAIVNEYMDRILPQLQTDGGQINWYSGEKIVAYFGLSDIADSYTPAARAVHAALRLHEIFAGFSQELLNSYASSLELDLRIGIATGELLRGSLGDANLQRPTWSAQNVQPHQPRQRQRRIVIGDVVNLAGQLEYEARPGHVLVDQKTVQEAREYFRFGSLGNRLLRRRTSPLEIFSVIGPLSPAPKVV